MERFQNRKIVSIIILCYIVILVLGWEFLQYHELKVRKIDSTQYVNYNMSEGFRYYIDEFSLDKDGIIGGWIIQEGTPIKTIAVKMALRSMTTGEIYVLPTEVTQRQDVTEYFNDGNDYDRSGFRVEVNNINEYFDIDSDDYTISFYMNLNEQEYLINTDTCIKDHPVRIINEE